MSKKRVKIIVVITALILLGFVGFALYSRNSQDAESNVAEKSYEQQQLELVEKHRAEKDYITALVHADNLRKHDPGNLDYQDLHTIILREVDAEAAKKVYSDQLDAILARDDIHGEGSPVSTYWTLAGLAEQAGRIDEAKDFYKKLIDSVDGSDPSEVSIAKQAKEALDRLTNE